MRELVEQAEVVGGAERNLLAAAGAWACASPSGNVWERQGLLIASSGVPMRSFNSVFVTGALPPTADTLRECCAWFVERGLRFRVRLLDDGSLPERELAAAGLEPRGGIPSLVLDLPSEPNPKAPGPQIRSVTDAQTLRDHFGVVAAGFDWDPGVLEQVFTERLLDEDRWRGYVGYADGRPVASSQLFVTDDVAGIYYVATREPYRRRGFGEAMTSHAIDEGRAAGCTVASLQASPAGLSIYERMGFRQVGYYRTYVLKEA